MTFYSNHHKDALTEMGVVDAGFQYGKIGKCDYCEIPNQKKKEYSA